MSKSLYIVLFLFLFSVEAFSQEVDFSTIPQTGTIMVFSHQDDDFIWMLPFWTKCEKFICGAMPATSVYEEAIHAQQLFLNDNGYNIQYEVNWNHPWDNISQLEYNRYYWNNDPAYSYLANDHLIALWDKTNSSLTRNEINRIKAKIEPYIASAGTARIITHNNWGEYGHQHHKAVNTAVRELAVKYNKDVWMLGCNNGDFIDIDVPPGIVYTLGNFDNILYSGLKNVYVNNGIWTGGTANPSGDHKFIEIVEAGCDKSTILTGETVTVSGPSQDKPGAYIFDGIDNYLTLPGNNFSSFTIAMWVRPDQINFMNISKMTEYPSFETCNRSFYMQNDGKVTARIYDGQSKTVTSQSTLSAGTWAHILMEGDSRSLKIYFNGSLQDEINTGAVFSGYTSPEFVLGQAQETASFFKGQISDVRLYDYVLTDDEIAAVCGANPPIIHTITSSAGLNGSISPVSNIIVNNGCNRTYTITADNYYQVSDVKVDNISIGPVTSYTFINITANHSITATFKSSPSVALNKPSFCQSSQDSRGPKFANDAIGTNDSYWAADPYPQWWKVDLGCNYDITLIVIRNYINNDFRYYKYEIHASTDDITYTKVAEKTNTKIATDEGDSYLISSTYRYLKVIMNFNNENKGVHISDFRVYGSPNISTWTGETSSDWHTLTNWFGEVPAAQRSVLIPYVSNYPVIIGSASCNNLTINASAKLVVGSNGNLTVNGSLTNGAGVSGLVIKSDADGTGSLIENSAASASVERFIDSKWFWHLLSSPVANQDIWPQFAPNPVLQVFTKPWDWDFYYFNPNCPPTGYSWVNLRKNSDGDYNDGSLDESSHNAGFRDAANTFPPKLEKGRGYLVAYSKGWNISSPETHLFSGLLNTGSVVKPIINNSNGSAFNLVGNPYPSSIDWDLADGVSTWGRLGALAVSGQGFDYWIWDDAIAGQYLFRNSASQIGNAGRFIEPGQGFFVQATADPKSLIFNNGIRTHSTDKGWVKSTSFTNNAIRLKLSSEVNSFYDEMFLDFNPAYSGLDGTPKFWSLYAEAPEIYSVKDGNNYSIDRYNQVNDSLTVNIGVKCGISGKYLITASNISSFTLPVNQVFLEDLKTGNKINLKVNNSYSFVGDPNDERSRFKISFGESIGVVESEALNQVYIYSFGKDVYVNYNQYNNSNFDVFIYNTLGNIVYKGKCVSGSGNNKLTTLNHQGAYIVKIMSDTGSKTFKIIIL